MADGRTLELIVAALEGTVSGDANTFLRNDHHFSATIQTGAALVATTSAISIPPHADVQLVSTLHGGQIAIRVNGALQQASLTYAVDLQAHGTYYFESSGGGLEERLNFSLTGSVTSGALALTIHEQYGNELVVANGNAASTADTTFNNTWTWHRATYHLRNGLIRRNFYNGRASELDTDWRASGQLLRNGQALGALALEQNEANFVKVILRLADQTRVLHRYQSAH